MLKYPKRARAPHPKDGWYPFDRDTIPSWLDSYDNNRAIRKATVATVRKEIEGNRFIPNGESIIVTTCGKLLDGQTRLEAALQAGKPILCYVVHLELGKEVSLKKVFDSIDGGAKRNLSDTLHCMGVEYDTSVAAVVRAVLGVERGERQPRVTNHDGRIRWQRDAERFNDAVRIVCTSQDIVRGCKDIDLPRSILSVVHFFGAPVDRRKVETFIESVATGENLSKNNPALVLRRKLAQCAKDRFVKPTRHDYLAMCAKAWNAYVKGRTIKTIRYGKDEPFPGFVGK